MPNQAEAWCRELAHLGLLSRFSKIPEGLHYSFILNFPTIPFTQIPPNKQSVTVYKEHFDSCIQKEIKNSHYLGPFSADTLASLIGPFQTSPLSVIPKPGKLGKFRLIQNLSFRHSFDPQFPNPSINSLINASDFPTTWGKFSIIYLLISRLPPGLEAVTCDVADAY